MSPPDTVEATEGDIWMLCEHQKSRKLIFMDQDFDDIGKFAVPPIISIAGFCACDPIFDSLTVLVQELRVLA
jgi:hypothetical protein